MTEHVPKHAAISMFLIRNCCYLLVFIAFDFPYACYLRFPSCLRLFLRVNNICLRLKISKLPIIKFLQPFLTSCPLRQYIFVSIELLTKCLQVGYKPELFNFLPIPSFTVVPFNVLIPGWAQNVVE